MDINGFSGVKRAKNANIATQIQGYEGPGKPGSASPKGRPDNASFDTSPYQSIVKSLMGFTAGGTNLIRPSNQSGSTKVGC